MFPFIAFFRTKLPHKQAASLAIPMILANLSTPLMGLADTAMLGQLEGAAFVGGVAVGANIFALLFWMLAFLRMSMTATVGQAFGGSNLAASFNAIIQSTALALFIAAGLILLHPLYLPLLISIVSQDETVYAHALMYSSIRIYAAIAVLLSYIIMGWLMGTQAMRAIVIITLCTNLCNIVLDYLFILRLDWGVEGAAWASVISDYLGLTLGLIFFIRTLNAHLSQTARDTFIRSLSITKIITLLSPNHIRTLLAANSNLFIRTALLLLVFNFFTAQGGTFGNNVLAANAILLQLMFIGTFAIDGYAYAAEIMIANAVGKKNVKLIHRATLATFFTGMVISVCAAMLFFAIKPFIILGMTAITEVRVELHRYYFWLYVMPLASVMCYLLDGVFIGAGKTRILRNWMIFSVVIIFIPSWLFFQYLHNNGLWLAFALFHIARGLTLLFAYYRFSHKNAWIDT